MNGLNEMCNKLEEYSVTELSKNKNAVNTKELGDVVDMMKDLSEVKKNKAEARYYEAITDAMEDSQYGQDYDFRGRMNYPMRGYEEPMASKMYDPRTMDMGTGRMYYSNNSSGRGANGGARGNSGRQSSGTRYGYSHDEYMEAKSAYSANDPEGKRIRMEKLEDYTDDLVESAKGLVEGMTPEEKQSWKMKISKLINM